MILPVRAFGDPVLRQSCSDVDKNDSALKQFLDNMWETMYNARGVGLAAPQVGKAIRLFLVDSLQLEDDLEGEKGIKKVFINAEITNKEGEEWDYNEGCLSIPHIREDVNRPSKITIKYYDEEFNYHEEDYDGIASRIIQHEYDHIEGILFTDYLKPLKKRMLKKKLNDISKGNVKTDYLMKFPLLKGRR